MQVFNIVPVTTPSVLGSVKPTPKPKNAIVRYPPGFRPMRGDEIDYIDSEGELFRGVILGLRHRITDTNGVVFEILVGRNLG